MASYKPHQRKVHTVNMSLHDQIMYELPVHFLQHIYSEFQDPKQSNKLIRIRFSNSEIKAQVLKN